MEKAIESDSFSFLECNKDLKSETLIDNTHVKLDAEMNEEAALDLEEEKEYIAMKQELEETTRRMEKWVYDSSHVEHFQDDKKRGEYLQPFLVIPMKNNDATCLRFSKDSNDLLAIGTSTGTIEIYNIRSGRFSYKLDVGRKGLHKWACTSMSFRPSKFAKVTENVLVSCDVNGQIHHWHATSEKHLALSVEQDNEIFAIDHHATGQKFATSGYDFKLRIYDGITRLPIQTFEKGNGVTTVGHSNRVFAVKWHPLDINVTLSAGWDKTIQIWDARIGTSVRSIYGVEIYGDALDINKENSRILTGSWRRTNQLQEWDYGSGKLLENIQWPTRNGIDEPCRLYAAKYGTKLSQKLIAVGGSGANEACFIDNDSKEVLGRISTIDKGVYGVAFSCNGTELAVLTPNAIHLISISKSFSNIIK